LAYENGCNYYEEFLGFLPLNTRFAPPSFDDPRLTAGMFKQLWESAEAPIELSTCYQEDVECLAGQLREWANEQTQEFPLSLGESDVTTHYCRTHCDRIHGALIDRFWYVERPVIVTLRPASRLEQYRVEKAYWEEVGDEQRSLLLQELIDAESPRTVDTEPGNQMAGSAPSENDSSENDDKTSREKEVRDGNSETD
jgi:hypothetical protein